VGVHGRSEVLEPTASARSPPCQRKKRLTRKLDWLCCGAHRASFQPKRPARVARTDKTLKGRSLTVLSDSSCRFRCPWTVNGFDRLCMCASLISSSIDPNPSLPHIENRLGTSPAMGSHSPPCEKFSQGSYLFGVRGSLRASTSAPPFPTPSGPRERRPPRRSRPTACVWAPRRSGGWPLVLPETPPTTPGSVRPVGARDSVRSCLLSSH
jgi:hypothetical protein